MPENIIPTEEKIADLLHSQMNVLQVAYYRVQIARTLLPPDAVTAAGHLDRADEQLLRVADLGRQMSALITALMRGARQHEVDLNEVIAKTASDCEVFLAGIEVRQTLAPGPFWTRVDAQMLADALLNLAFNARDAMRAGGVLTFATHQQDDGRMVCVQVADTGTGIDAATLARMWEKGYTTKGARGSGLGLAMVKEFCEAHGGTVNVDTAVGRGTTFELCFPRVLLPDPTRPTSGVRAAVQAVEQATQDAAEKASRAVSAVTRSEAS